MQNTKILISGSLGFISSNLIRKMIYEKEPYDIISIDKVSNNLNAAYFNKSHSFHIANLCDQNILNSIFEFEQPEIVLHMAASTHVDFSISNPSEFVMNNVLATQNVINACVKYKIKKLIYVSTDETLGQLSTTDEPWNENAPLNPRNPYAVTKASGEMLLDAAWNSWNLPFIKIRMSNNYGNRQDSSKLIPKVIKCINNNLEIPIYGKGEEIRDWLHVFDSCAGIIKILNNGLDNNIYHIAANQESSNIDLVNMICNKMGKGHELIKLIDDPRKNAHDFRYAMNCDKLKALGWKPKLKLSDGLDNTLLWFKSNSYFLK